MDKGKILVEILGNLERDRTRIRGANRSAASGATDSESRAESKWDTQGLEASYLARGYAQQYEQLVANAEKLKSFESISFAGKPVGVGALVKCQAGEFVDWYFLLPCCGGMELQAEGEALTIITVDSPLGVALAGKREGDSYRQPNGEPALILAVE